MGKFHIPGFTYEETYFDDADLVDAVAELNKRFMELKAPQGLKAIPSEDRTFIDVVGPRFEFIIPDRYKTWPVSYGRDARGGPIRPSSKEARRVAAE